MKLSPRKPFLHVGDHLAITLLLLSLRSGLRQAMPQATPGDGPKGQPLQRLTVLTFNTLHGLAPSGLTVKASESKDVRQPRLNCQFQQLSLIQPELMLLREVNPLPDMAKAYVEALQGFGLHYARPGSGSWIEQWPRCSC